MKTTAVIMAGGRGERFWPKSRNNRPKQFLSLTSDGETMIQKTVKRLLPLVDMEDIYIVTNAAYTELVLDQLPDLPKENILAEPCARNTAPCIAFAAAVIKQKYDDAVMLVLPSDHLIGYEDIYINTLKKAIRAAEQGKNLVTIGITPTYPETGYGYINFGKECGDTYEVERFVEKPDLPTAKEYLASGKYLWNSGMFVWKVTSILADMKEFMPDIYDGAVRIGEAFNTPGFEDVLVKEFYAFRSESVDFGIMEKADNIYTIPGSFGWDDVGSWLAVERINETDDDKNYIEGDVISIGSERTTICGGKRLVAAVGLEDIIIVDTDDAVLVCSKNSTQDVKKVIAQLKEAKREELV
ncbi:mannose-1-phosphate guanylyltransferase [Ruminococcus sp. XPD3002]|uniref:mannose-1-phosphate guanylyltransferase n=1 Tax=Ruminococcus sp. XPD3002 TaxID=1452269 RepID=UPI00091D030F|nr:mannose-1-phosphate guanylyltransferase [Ruminococcus flavefaciens]